MALSKVAIRYAQSFLETSIERNTLDKVSIDFDLIYNAFTKNDELLRAIKNPVIRAELKKQVLNSIFSNKISKDASDYLNFIIDKGREEIILEVLEKFELLKDEHYGIVKVIVNTAFEFSDAQKNQLQKKFEEFLNKKVKLTFYVNSDLIGGFVARVGDTVYNASLLHQLGLLKKKFLEGSLSLN